MWELQHGPQVTKDVKNKPEILLKIPKKEKKQVLKKIKLENTHKKTSTHNLNKYIKKGKNKKQHKKKDKKMN